MMQRREALGLPPGDTDPFNETLKAEQREVGLFKLRFMDLKASYLFRCKDEELTGHGHHICKSLFWQASVQKRLSLPMWGRGFGLGFLHETVSAARAFQMGK